MITYANDRSDAYYARRAALRRKNVSRGKVRRMFKLSKSLKSLRKELEVVQLVSTQRFLYVEDTIKTLKSRLKRSISKKIAHGTNLLKQLNDEEALELARREHKLWPLALHPRSS